MRLRANNLTLVLNEFTLAVFGVLDSTHLIPCEKGWRRGGRETLFEQKEKEWVMLQLS